MYIFNPVISKSIRNGECDHGRLITLTMEAARISETSVNIYQTTRRKIPEDSHLHSRRHENQKSHTQTTGVSYIAYKTPSVPRRYPARQV
jgi:hypothetical protein